MSQLQNTVHEVWGILIVHTTTMYFYPGNLHITYQNKRFLYFDSHNDANYMYMYGTCMWWYAQAQ